MGDIRSMRGGSIWLGIGRALATTLVFVVIGPPIGAITMFACISASNAARSMDLSGLGWIGLFTLIYGVPMSYLIGAPTAAMAGIVLGLGRAFLSWVSWKPAFLVGVALSLILVKSTEPIQLMFIGVLFVPTLVCWWIARRLVPAGRSGSER